MKYEFPYKPGDVVTIYADWERQETPIGEAKLVEFRKQGLSFILEDTYPEADQIVYNWQEWDVSWINPEPVNNVKYDLFTCEKIRYIDTVGIANSADDEDEEDDYSPPSKDSFLE